MDLAHLEWPFFDDSIGVSPMGFPPGRAARSQTISITRDTDRACRNLVRALGEAGWLKAVIPAAYGGLSDEP